MRLTTLIPVLPLFSILPLAIARPWNPTLDTCPTTIKTIISSDPCSYRGFSCSDEPQYTTMGNLHKVLLTCPNITALDLRVTGLGCSSWPERWNFPFHPAGGEAYPALKTLRLEGYEFTSSGYRGRENWHVPKMRYYPDWGNDVFWWFPDGGWTGQMATWIWEGRWWMWMQWRRLPEEQRVKTNFRLWLDAMDWGEIEELALLDRPSSEIVENLPRRLKGLKRLETTSRRFVEGLERNTLEELKWVGHSVNEKTLPTILEKQGESLKSLEFRCEELGCLRFTTGFEIGILPNMTSNLTHLSINVPRNGTWPLQTLQTIASLPRLQSADLWMNLQSKCRQQKPDDYSSVQQEWEREHGKDYCGGEDQFQKPFVDKEGVEELFAFMKEKNEGGELKNVTFWVGDWSRSWDGPLYDPPWAEGKRARITCGMEAKSESKGSCIIDEGKEYWKYHGKGSQQWYEEAYEDYENFKIFEP